MDNNKKEIFLNGVEENVKEEEIVLASPEEMMDEAKEIAQNTESDEKYAFVLESDINQKTLLHSMLQKVGAVVENDGEEGHTFSVWMNMTQLAFIKRLHCVERVRSHENTNPFLTGEAEDPSLDRMEQQDEEMTASEPTMANSMIIKNTVAAKSNLMTAAAVPEDQTVDNGVAVASVASMSTGSTSSTFPTNTTMETATEIEDEGIRAGNIPCPGREQWFKFTTTRTGRYTICTMGSLDTIGTLYNSCGDQIAEVDDYEPCGKLNFRIIERLRANTTYYIRVRLFGNDTGGYILKVTEKVLVNYVTINQDKISIDEGVLYELPITPNYTYKGYNGAKPIPGLSVSLNPSNADEQSVWWSKFGRILDVKYGWDNDDERYIHVIATGKGIAKLYAEDTGENGEYDECAVYVGGAPVTGITLDQTSKTIRVDDGDWIRATVLPANALNKTVTWRSNNSKVATVDADGWVTAKKGGTAQIRAQTEEGGFLATCTVTVDPDKRERVRIKKDSHSFYVQFEDEYGDPGVIWRNIGLDLSNRSDNYTQMYPPNMDEAYYDQLIAEEQRYLDNLNDKFTVDQLAYLYLLDPLGIEFYMKTSAFDHMEYISEKEEESLSFREKQRKFLKVKDNLYESIFGTSERNGGHFKFTVADNRACYGWYNDSDRLDIYTNAEVLFGFHTIIDWDLSEFIKSVLEGLFDCLIGAVLEESVISDAREACQLLFHSGGIVGACSSKATSFLNEYLEDEVRENVVNKYKDKYGEEFVMIKRTTVHWAFKLLVILADSFLGAFDIPNPKDITIYNKVDASPKYLTIVEGLDGDLSMKDIIAHVQQN